MSHSRITNLKGTPPVAALGLISPQRMGCRADALTRLADGRSHQGVRLHLRARRREWRDPADWHEAMGEARRECRCFTKEAPAQLQTSNNQKGTSR